MRRSLLAIHIGKEKDRLEPFARTIRLANEGRTWLESLAGDALSFLNREVVDPRDVLSEGQEVDVQVLDVDPQNRRISLGLKQTEPNPWDLVRVNHPVGSHVRGKVKSLTDFGQDGPWRDFQMNDAAHLALGGQMSSTGYSDPAVTPIGGQGHQAWHMGCVFALHGITLALFDRMTTGEGQYIDVSIHDACSIGTGSERACAPITSTMRPRGRRRCCRGSKPASGSPSSRTRGSPAFPTQARGSLPGRSRPA